MKSPPLVEAWQRWRCAGVAASVLACGFTTAPGPSINCRLAKCDESDIAGRRERALEQFTDSTFPAKRKSLGMGEAMPRHAWKRKKNWSQLKWCRASTIHALNNGTAKPCALFCTPIEPNDISQGDLGNCYFMAALGALAARGQGEAIRKLFPPTKQQPERGLYTCRMFASGVEHEIAIDDLLPCSFAPPGTHYMDGSTVQPAFAQPMNGELWVPLLEKAWAKLHGSYGRTTSGDPSKSLADLTGAPAYKIRTRKHGSSDDQTGVKRPLSSSQQIWAVLTEAEQRRYPCCASAVDEAQLSTKRFQTQAVAAKGLTLNHA